MEWLINRLTIIGNLTRDPEMRTTTNGKNVCSFTVAVNRRKTGNDQEPQADFFKVSAWNQTADNCAKYLSKGKKVCVIGPVSVRTYQANDGTTRASLEVTANDIEFLSARNDNPEQPAKIDKQSGFQQVETDELPF